MKFKKWAGLLLAPIVVLALTAAEGGCEGDAKDRGKQPDPKIDANVPEQRIIALEWYANQPYTAKWNIEGGKGLYPNGEEHVAAGQYKKELQVGKTALIITIGTKSAKGSTGWAKITDKKEVAFVTFNSGSNPAVATAVYHYNP